MHCGPYTASEIQFVCTAYGQRGGNWRLEELHSEKLCDLYRSPDAVQVIRSNRTGWVAVWGEKRNGWSGCTHSRVCPVAVVVLGYSTVDEHA